MRRDRNQMSKGVSHAIKGPPQKKNLRNQDKKELYLVDISDKIEQPPK